MEWSANLLAGGSKLEGVGPVGVLFALLAMGIIAAMIVIKRKRDGHE